MMDFTGGSNANNYTPTSNSYSSSTSSEIIVKSLTGPYYSEVAVPISIRPVSGLTYPRYS